MKKEIKITIKEEHINNSTQNMFRTGFTSAQECLGGEATYDTINRPTSPELFAVRYLKAKVSIDKKYDYSKDAVANEVDMANDAVCQEAALKFGWRAGRFSLPQFKANRAEVIKFMHDKLKHLVGRTITLTLRTPKNKGAHCHDKKGKATGGNRTPRVCSRMERIAKDAREALCPR